MNKLRRNGEKIKPDFTEDEFICALETSLNRSNYYRDKEVEISRISQADEHILGYDGIVTGVVPFYVQFKRSDFYTSEFKGKLLKDRKSLNIPFDKGFFGFEFLKKNNSYEQHNIMYKLSQKAKAVYVAPLFFKKHDLSRMRFWDQSRPPVFYEDLSMTSLGRSLVSFKNMRLFRETITIPPHAEVKDKAVSHHYSYCKGRKIGFHSDPVNLGDSGSQTLSEFLEDIVSLEFGNSEEVVNEVYNQIPSFFNLRADEEDFQEILRSSIERVALVGNIEASDAKFSIFDKLLVIEDILSSYFDIKQFAKYEIF